MGNRILVVDDEKNMLLLLSTILEEEGYRVVTAFNGEEALRSLEACTEPGRSGGVDLVLSDLRMSKMDGLALLRRSKEISPSTPFIIITGYGAIESAVEAMRSGAYDYITKPFDNNEVIGIVRKALEYQTLIKHVPDPYTLHPTPLDEDNGGLFGDIKIIGRHENMRGLFSLIRKVAESDATVLIYGESGVGKELVARAIHNISHRRDAPFTPIDCGSLPETLLESELFGHVKGAFTDAIITKKGLFEEGNGGTIFLDEIAGTSLLFQSKLMRALQEKEIKPVGSNKRMKVDVRIISASNRNLHTSIRQRTFREDLYYRLSVVPLFIPPLRERREDIPLLVDHFIKKYQKEGEVERFVSQETLKLLRDYPWNGNVRELENTIERAMVLSSGQELKIDLVSRKKQRFINEEATLKESIREISREIGKERILEALIRTKMNHKEAARLLGISRATLYNKIREYNIDLKA
ncbi:MAG: sigma-54-dependent Fis family transcriptional regulator [Nitrospirae bacterium]|nr:sigma-54-dependent Fis family transcriptional regulator [Nitrospirota bacterium]